MDILIPVGITALLIVLNGLFVAAEFAMVGAPRAALERRAAGGDKWAVMAFRVLQDPRRQDQFIATAQLGITLASLGLGMYGEHMLAGWIASQMESLGAWRWLAAHATASVLAVAILTYFHIVIGEMVPKAMALQRAERVLVFVTPIMETIRRVLFPLVATLNGVGNFLLRRVGIDRSKDTHQAHHSAEELRSIVQESQRGGVLDAETGRLVQEIFSLDELTAGDVMVPRVKLKAVELNAEVAELAALVKLGQHTRYPVFQENLDKIVGVLHSQDILRLVSEGRRLRPEDVRAVSHVPATASTERVMQAMWESRTQMCVVLDEFGGTAGLVTLTDIFEEVVGRIDEEANAAPALRYDASGKLVASGLMRLDEAAEALNRPLVHEDVDTIGGLVLALLGRPPSVGDRVEYSGLCFDVVEVDGHAVAWCSIVPCEPKESAVTYQSEPV